jgi:hypothetical protein
MGCGLDFGDDHLYAFSSIQKPQLKDSLNGFVLETSENARNEFLL